VASNESSSNNINLKKRGRGRPPKNHDKVTDKKNSDVLIFPSGDSQSQEAKAS